MTASSSNLTVSAVRISAEDRAVRGRGR